VGQGGRASIFSYEILSKSNSIAVLTCNIEVTKRESFFCNLNQCKPLLVLLVAVGILFWDQAEWKGDFSREIKSIVFAFPR
jgi:hypothetical protein